MRRGWPLGAALLLAPIAGAFPLALLLSLAALISQSRESALFLAALWAILAVVNFFATATLGLAWHAFAQRRQWRNWLAYAGAGCVLGALLMLISRLIMTGPFNPAGIASSPVALGANILVGGLNGAFTALAFWLIRRPDRDARSDDPAVFE